MCGTGCGARARIRSSDQRGAAPTRAVARSAALAAPSTRERKTPAVPAFGFNLEARQCSLEPLAKPGEVCQMALYAARCLKNYRSSCLADDRGKILGWDLAITQVGVPINAGVEFTLRVIGVH